MAETTETTEEVREQPGPYKIWKNPDCPDDPIQYVGDYYPPEGRPYFVAKDLIDLGLGPGKYTIRAPENRRWARLIPKWHTVSVGG